MACRYLPLITCKVKKLICQHLNAMFALCIFAIIYLFLNVQLSQSAGKTTSVVLPQQHDATCATGKTRYNFFYVLPHHVAYVIVVVCVAVVAFVVVVDDDDIWLDQPWPLMNTAFNQKQQQQQQQQPLRHLKLTQLIFHNYWKCVPQCTTSSKLWDQTKNLRQTAGVLAARSTLVTK